MALGLRLEIPLCLPAAQGAVLPPGPSTRWSAGGAEWVWLSAWPQVWGGRGGGLRERGRERQGLESQRGLVAGVFWGKHGSLC